MESQENNNRRVVVAEDEALIRLDIVESLEDAGYQVVGQAANGDEAVELARSEHPGVVIMDVKMPGSDGISAAKTITEEGIAPVVVLTAFSQQALVKEASEAGAMAYVVKPFVPDKLFPAIEVAMARFEQMTELKEQIGDLKKRFAARKKVDRAKGLLMENMGLSEAEAFRWIQKTSMDRRLTMEEVADAVIDQVHD
ncbi:MAG: response regulator [Bifidobacteriaceae bacterium]|nr:response regulator [Aeriscardovia sp.]MEE1324638.1 response regulator [Bifidobacteriaceae bacterium]